MGDWLMLTIKIIHILWRQVGSLANSGGIGLESQDGRYLSLVHTYAATQTVSWDNDDRNIFITDLRGIEKHIKKKKQNDQYVKVDM